MASEIKHFLIKYDIKAGRANVQTSVMTTRWLCMRTRSLSGAPAREL